MVKEDNLEVSEDTKLWQRPLASNRTNDRYLKKKATFTELKVTFKTVSKWNEEILPTFRSHTIPGVYSTLKTWSEKYGMKITDEKTVYCLMKFRHLIGMHHSLHHHTS